MNSIFIYLLSTDVPSPTVQLLVSELTAVTDDWFTFGVLLGVPPSRLKAIQASKGQGGVQQWKVDMFQAWLDNKLDASWEDIVSALKQLENLRLATKLKKKYLMKHSQENSQGKILSA